MKIFDNVSEIVRDDMAQAIQAGSKVSIALDGYTLIYAVRAIEKGDTV